ncbi:hypothetical protein PanWU01x14_115170, partial [Parasponia andersonii]
TCHFLLYCHQVEVKRLLGSFKEDGSPIRTLARFTKGRCSSPSSLGQLPFIFSQAFCELSLLQCAPASLSTVMVGSNASLLIRFLFGFLFFLITTAFIWRSDPLLNSTSPSKHPTRISECSILQSESIVLPSLKLKVSDSTVTISEPLSSMLPLETNADKSTSSHSEASADFILCLFLLNNPSRTTEADMFPAVLLSSLHCTIEPRNLRDSSLDEVLDLLTIGSFFCGTPPCKRKFLDLFREENIVRKGISVTAVVSVGSSFSPTASTGAVAEVSSTGGLGSFPSAVEDEELNLESRVASGASCRSLDPRFADESTEFPPLI